MSSLVEILYIIAIVVTIVIGYLELHSTIGILWGLGVSIGVLVSLIPFAGCLIYQFYIVPMVNSYVSLTPAMHLVETFWLIVSYGTTIASSIITIILILIFLKHREDLREIIRELY